MAVSREIPNKWRNRVLVIGGLVVALCLCLVALPGTRRRNTRATDTAAPAVQATATSAPPTATEIVLPSATTEPTRTPRPPTATRTRIPTLTPRPATATPEPMPPTDTAAPAPTQPLPTAVVPTPLPIVPAATATVQAPLPTAPLPTQPPAGITLISLTSPVAAGANANLVIQTAPGVSCFLTYTTPSGNRSEAQGLGATTADGNGLCGWTWRIGSSTNPGTGRLSVSAGTANASFEIIIQ